MLDGVGGQRHAPSALPPEKTRYPLSGSVRKILPPPAFDPRTVQPVASRCTDWAIPARVIYIRKWNLSKSYCTSRLLKAANNKQIAICLLETVPYVMSLKITGVCPPNLLHAHFGPHLHFCLLFHCFFVSYHARRCSLYARAYWKICVLPSQGK